MQQDSGSRLYFLCSSKNVKMLWGGWDMSGKESVSWARQDFLGHGRTFGSFPNTLRRNMGLFLLMDLEDFLV